MVSKYQRSHVQAPPPSRICSAPDAPPNQSQVREMVGPDVEIVLDGGVRRGIDIVKGLARGADSVAIGPSPSP